MLFHAVVIYTVPAVSMFAEGEMAASEGELIEVDVLPAEESDMAAEIVPTETNQFQTAASPTAEAAPLASETADDLPSPALADAADEYLLLARPNSSEPAMPAPPALQKRDPQQPPVLPLPQRVEMQEPLQIDPLQQKLPPAADRAPAQLNFPRLTQRPEKPPISPAELMAPSSTGITKRRALEEDVALPDAPRSFGKASQAAAKHQIGLPKQLETDENRFGIFAGKAFEERQAQEMLQEIAKKEQKTPAEITPAKTLPPDQQIEGPLKGRRIIHRPPSPNVKIAMTVELKLKFWVLPDGTIGEIIPLKRGNAKLEQIAMAYIKQFQFEPLPSNVSQQKIWGTIPIKFSVR